MARRPRPYWAPEREAERPRLCAALFAVAVALAAAATRVSAEQLPLRSYTTADGLPHDRIKRIVTDRLGFVWFCTLEGLSRFDGRSFVTFGVAEGLPVPSANDILETPEGSWVATNGGGVAFFDPAGISPRFRTLSTGKDAASRVNVLLRERDGSLLAGTDGGLFRLSAKAGSTFRAVPLGIPGYADASVPVWALLQAAPGVFVGTQRGLVLVAPDGATRLVSAFQEHPGPIWALADAGDGKILVGTGGREGLVVLDSTSLAPVRRLTVNDGLPPWSCSCFRRTRALSRMRIAACE